MQFLVDILKSKGKLGGAGLMVIGLVQMVLVYTGKLQGSYQEGAATFFLGLGLLGIRSKQDVPPAV
jgi:hypothetical protein